MAVRFVKALIHSVKNRFPLHIEGIYFILAVPVGNPEDLFSIEYVTWSVASDAILPTSGFRVNGAESSSGDGSIDITAVPPAKSVGNVNPLGASIRKSSPGKGGAASVPL